MPTYEYGCLCCKNEFEVEQSVKAEPYAECPKCHVSCYNRLISRSTSFVLKGGGWATDNYSKSSS